MSAGNMMIRMLSAEPGEVYVTTGYEESFPALIYPGRWNGFIHPAFRVEAVEAIRLWLLKLRAENKFDEWDELTWDKSDVLYMSSFMLDDDPKCQPERYVPDERGRYSVGAYVWTWSVVE